MGVKYFVTPYRLQNIQWQQMLISGYIFLEAQNSSHSLFDIILTAAFKEMLYYDSPFTGKEMRLRDVR